MPAPSQQQMAMSAPSMQPEPNDTMSGDMDFSSENMSEPNMGSPENDNLNAFGKEKFDAGIDVDEDADPKKYIEKLTGKLAQKLRDYNGTEQDVDLNKFVVNSLIPAAVPQMDETDAKDVIKKVQDNIGKSGQESGQDMSQENSQIPDSDQGIEQESGQNELPPVPQQESKSDDIDDLINEVLGVRKSNKSIKRKNPFKSPKFK